MRQYTLVFTDQHGEPVPGVIAQVCDESICMIYTSDANGRCQFELEGKAYDVHVLMPPAGYADEAKLTQQTPAAGGELGRSPEEEKERQAYRATLIPAGKVGNVADIANAAVYLGSDESSYVSGVELLVDGGLAAVYPVKL
jgi:hypothetical protein